MSAPWLNMHPVSSASRSPSSLFDTCASASQQSSAVRNRRSFNDNRRHAVYFLNEDVGTRRLGVVVQDEAVLAALSKLGYVRSDLSADTSAALRTKRKFCSDGCKVGSVHGEYQRRWEKVRLAEVALGRLLG
jgi:hypothetical protein